MTDTITAGSILVEEGTRLPGDLLLQSESDSNGWAAVKGLRAAFDTTIQEAGWTFFFMAGEVKATVFGFNKPKARGTALKRLIKDVKSQHCNSIEITKVVDKSFLSMPYVCVSARPRHLQEGMRFSG